MSSFTTNKPCKEISVLYTPYFWAMNIVQTSIFVCYSFYTVSILKDKLEKNNYVLISTFCVVLFLRLILDTYLQLNSNFGNETCTIDFSTTPTESMITIYISRFILDLLDIILVLFFYKIVMDMQNFWDQLYYENVYQNLMDGDETLSDAQLATLTNELKTA